MTENLILSEFKGMGILSSDVFNKNGVMLAEKDTILNQYIVQHLMAHDIKSVSIYHSSINVNYCASNDNIEKSYINSLYKTKMMFQELLSGKTLDYQIIAYITDQIQQYSNYESAQIIKFLAEIRSKDEYTYTHCVNVAFYSMLIAKWLKLPNVEINKAIQAGFLHDIGKVKAPEELLNKKGILTQEEFEIIKRHPIHGYEIIKDITEIDTDVKDAVLLHHERVDGSGYPFHYYRDNLSLYSRVVAIADVFDAMTSDRVYKKRTTPFEVFEMFQTMGITIYDSDILKTFINKLSIYLIGVNVCLSNGDTAELIFVPPQNVSYPIVKTTTGYIDLSQINDIKILHMV
jgi:putative nucleotidyltransferase with HDIG domain